MRPSYNVQGAYSQKPKNFVRLIFFVSLNLRKKLVFTKFTIKMRKNFS